MKRYLAWPSIVGLLAGICAVQSSSAAAAADASDRAWESLTAPIDGMDEVAARERLSLPWERTAWTERFNRQYRDRGAAFFGRFPNDQRFGEWFLSTAAGGLYTPTRDLHYWRDPSAAAKLWENHDPAIRDENGAGGRLVDTDAMRAWAGRYLVYRRRFLEDPNVSDQDKVAFQDYELREEIYENLNVPVCRLPGDPGLAQEHKRGEILRYGDEVLRLSKDQDLGYLEDGFLEVANHDRELGEAFLSLLESSRNATTRQHARETAAYFTALRMQPAHLVVRGLGGVELDLEKLREKVVLLEFWNIHCGGCIAGMPKMERLYRKYGKDGFAMLSVCVISGNGKDEKSAADRAKAIQLEDKQGATFPTGELDSQDDTGKRVETNVDWNHFGQAAGGGTFFIDQHGLVIATFVAGTWAEFYIRQLLGLPRMTLNPDAID